MLRQCGWKGVKVPGGKKRYEDARFNVISEGVGRYQISKKKHYVTLEWSITSDPK